MFFLRDGLCKTIIFIYLFIFFWHVGASIKVEFNNDFIPIFIELNHIQGRALTFGEVF